MNNPVPNGLERRKARTRAALVAAAQGFLAQDAATVSIQDITDAAGVGFGSFFNHFESKDALFAEAVTVTLETWGELRDVLVSHLEDPAEIFAMTFRMTGRLQRAHPEMVRIILNSGMAVLVNDRGLRPRAVADIAAATEAGRFTTLDVDVAVMAAGGALLGLMQLLESRPDIDDGVTADAFAERVLLMFGLAHDDARAIVAKPLPEIPQLA